MRNYLLLVLLASAVFGQPVKVAVVRDTRSATDTTPVDQTIAALHKSGFVVQIMDTTQLQSPDTLNASLYDCLVLTHTAGLAQPARQNLTKFLRDGGDLVLLGGTGFTQHDSMILPAFST